MGKRLSARAQGKLDSRHLRWESFEARIKKGPPSVEAVSGYPTVHLFIEPAGRRVGARFFSRGDVIVPSPLAEVAIRRIGIGSDTALEISTDNAPLYRDFYSMCCSIADRVQIEKQPVGLAIARTLASWAALIRRKSLLSQEREIGLLGELLFLRRVARSLGWSAAVRSWCGPDSEEHDFVLPSVDAEVKTTTREQRVHQITSLTQLSPKSGRHLKFVSVQLTSGGAGRDAFSLAEMVASSLALAASSVPSSADIIRDQIQRLGWEDEDAANYMTRFFFRAPLMVAPVGSGFPAIVPDALSMLGQSAASRVENVSYSINVDGLGVLDGSRAFERSLFSKRGL